MKTTEKILNVLLDEINYYRAGAGFPRLFFTKEALLLKLQKRHVYQLYMFANDGCSRLKVLEKKQKANELQLYLTGTLEGVRIGMNVALNKSVV